MYLTYDEYRAYHGTLDADTFNDLEFQAEAIINYYTFNRLKSDTVFPEQVKRLTKYLIELCKKKLDSLSLGSGNESSTATGTYITNQSNDGVSVSYSSMPSVNLYDLCGDEAKLAVQRYLEGVTNELGRNLLYRGLYRGE